MYLIGVCKTTHTTHDSKNIVVDSIYSYFAWSSFSYCVSSQGQMKSCVINSTEITGSRWLMFFRAKSKGVTVDTRIWSSCVMLEWLNQIEVGSFTFTESVLAIKLQFSSNNWIFTPTVPFEYLLSIIYIYIYIYQ